MIYYVLRRILIGVPLVVGVAVVDFLLLHLLPGDPVAAALGGAPATPESIHNLQKQLGLNKSLVTQFWQFVVDALQGDLGRSYTTNESVTSLIGSQLGATVQLAAAALLFAVVIGVVGGILAALYRGRLVDHLMRFASIGGSAMPQFWVGMMLIIGFSFGLRWFPAAGSGGIRYLVLPSIALGLLSAGVIIRVVRNSVLETLGMPFVGALHAKGISPFQLIGRHVIRNSMIAALTVVGVEVGNLLSGAVIVETVFGRPGIGSLLVNAVENKNYPVIQGLMLFIAVIYVAVNLIVDVSYAYLDPRIRSAFVST